MNISTVETTTLRDHVITTTLEDCGGMIRNLARKLNIDFEDARQEAAREMLEAWDKMPATCKNVGAYLNGCARNSIFKMRRGSIETLSLDEPIAKDSKETFADMLQAFVQTENTTQVDVIIETVHSALRECWLEEQEYAGTMFEMNAFEPVAPVGTEKLRKKNKGGPKIRDTGNIRKSLLLHLRKNPQVQALIQRETCVL